MDVSHMGKKQDGSSSSLGGASASSMAVLGAAASATAKAHARASFSSRFVTVPGFGTVRAGVEGMSDASEGGAVDGPLATATSSAVVGAPPGNHLWQELGTPPQHEQYGQQQLVRAASPIRVNRKKLDSICNQSDSEDEGLVAMSFAGLSGAASLGIDLDQWSPKSGAASHTLTHT